MAGADLPPALGKRLPPVWAVEPGLRARNLLGRAHRAMMPPALPVLEQMDRMIEVRLVAVACELGLPDLVAAGPAPRPRWPTPGTSTPTPRSGCCATSPRRVGSASRAGGAATASSRFGLTTTGALLRADHPDGLRDWARFAGADWMSRIWNHAAHTVRTGESASVAATGQPFFDFLDADPTADALFDGAMRGGSGLQSRLLVEAIDFTRFGRICDVAGGTGPDARHGAGRAPREPAGCWSSGPP